MFFSSILCGPWPFTLPKTELYCILWYTALLHPEQLICGGNYLSKVPCRETYSTFNLSWLHRFAD